MTLLLSDEFEAAEEEDVGVLDDESEPLATLNINGDELIPHCGMEDEEVEALNVPYSVRAAGDWVSSGTLYRELPGRYFPSWDHAEKWAREFFGRRFKGRMMDAYNSNGHRWAFLIRGPRGQ